MGIIGNVVNQSPSAQLAGPLPKIKPSVSVPFIDQFVVKGDT
jgi:hypothetical protein